LRVLRPEQEATISTVAAKKYGIIHGEMVAVETPRGSIKMKANVTEDILPGVVSVPHVWASGNSNILLDSKLLDRVSGYITLNGVACRPNKLS
jgi:anaerobic selenocysteine-containing dehydrogenase